MTRDSRRLHRAKRSSLLACAAIAAFAYLASGAAMAADAGCLESGRLRPVLEVVHSSGVGAIAVSTVSQHILTAGPDGSIVLWDHADGVQALAVWHHRPFPDIQSAPRIAFSPRHTQFFAAVVENGRVRIGRFPYDVASRECAIGAASHFTVDLVDLGAIAVSPDGTLLAVGGLVARAEGRGHFARVHLLDATTGQRAATPLDFADHQLAPLLAWGRPSAGEQILAIAENSMNRESGPLYVVEPIAGRLVRSLSHPRRPKGVSALAFSPDGQTLAAGTHDSLVFEWTVAGGTAEVFEHGPAASREVATAISSVGFLQARDGRQARIVSIGGAGQDARLWPDPRGDARATAVPGVTVVAAAPAGHDGRLVIASQNGDLHLLDPVLAFVAPSFRRRSAGKAIGVELHEDRRWVLVSYETAGAAAPASVIGLLFDAKQGTLARVHESAASRRAAFRFGPATQTLVTPAGEVVDFEGRPIAGGAPAGAILSASGSAWLVADFKARRVSVRGVAGEAPAAEVSLPDGVRGVQSFDAAAGLSRIALLAQLEGGATEVLVWDAASRAYAARVARANVRTLAVRLSDDAVLIDGDDPMLMRFGAAKPEVKPVPLPPNVRATTAVFAPDRESLLVGTRAGRVLHVTFDGKSRMLGEHQESVTGLSSSRRDGIAASASDDGTVLFWDLKTGMQVLALAAFTGEQPVANDRRTPQFEWVAMDPKGRFDASDVREVHGLHWAAGLDAIELRQLQRHYLQPLLFEQTIGAGSAQKLRTVKELDSVPRPPAVRPDPPAPSDKGAVRFSFTDRGGGIGRYEIFLNGREVRQSSVGREVREQTVTLDLKELAPFIKRNQPNVVRVRAYDQDGQIASRGVSHVFESVDLGTVEAPPRLFVLAVGVSDYADPALKLKLAHRDATRFATALKNAARPLLSDADMSIKVLASPQGSGELPADKATIERVLTDFREKEGMKWSDVLVVFLAGHGATLADSESEYFFLTRDARSQGDVESPEDRKRVALSSGELATLLKRLPANKQVLIVDTCYAAGVMRGFNSRALGEEERRIIALNSLRDRNGMHVIGSAADNRVAYESMRFGHGLLTYALLQALMGGARGERDAINVGTALRFAENKVPDLARDIRGVQQPKYFSAGDDFQIGHYQLEQWGEFGPLSSRAVVLRPEFRDPDFVDSERLEDGVWELMTDESDSPGGKFAVLDQESYADGYNVRGEYKRNDDGTLKLDFRVWHTKAKTADAGSWVRADGMPPTQAVRWIFEQVRAKLPEPAPYKP